MHMKQFIALLLTVILILSGCTQSKTQEKPNSSTIETKSVDQDSLSDVQLSEDNEEENTRFSEIEETDLEPYEYTVDYDSLNDAELMRYVEDSVYESVVKELNSDEYFVENITTTYISQEYIDELEYNSKPNIYFGYTLAELDEAFQGTRYIFTLGENGETIVKPLEKYDDTYDQIIKNVAIGTGVILVCVTVSVVTAGAGAPAVSMVFAASAKTGTAFALSSGALGGVAAGAITGIKTGDMNQALKAGALAGSEGFKWGAILGACSGGASEAIALKGATLNGLTMNEAATIQKESGYPIEVIKQLHTMKEYEVFKAADLKAHMVNGKIALIRSDFDLKLLDEMGRTNLERMKLGLAPRDVNGVSYELHHIGQKSDATLAILTQAEHDNAVLHGFKDISEVNHALFATQRSKFWKEMANLLSKGAL